MDDWSSKWTNEGEVSGHIVAATSRTKIQFILKSGDNLP